MLPFRIASMTAAVLCVLLPAMATAGDIGWSTTVMAGYRDGGRLADPDSGNRLDITGANSGALVVNFPHSPDGQYELFYGRQETDMAGRDIDVRLEYLHFGGRLWLREAGSAAYLAGTLGATRIRARADTPGSDTRPSISLGLGLELPLGERWHFRMEARGYATLTEGDRNILCISSRDGLECKLGYHGDALVQLEALAGFGIRF